MERRFGAEPDPAARSTERESRSFRRIQGGDAAKAAEESARESTPYQGAFGIRLRATSGVKFELEKESEGPGEASPRPVSAVQSGTQSVPVSSQAAQADESDAGITKKLFRKLFRP